jgi:phage/plasmid primase-like uncharacterized protein
MFGRAAGGAGRLAPADRGLMVSEGIESGLSAQQACALPCWAALSTSGLTALVLPPIVETVIILADHDVNGAGQRTAYAVAERFLREKRRVKVALPPEPDTDFNDVLLGRAYAATGDAGNVAA